MPEIDAKQKSIKFLLGEKYTVDVYQREYKWAEKQVDDLAGDLLSAFDENYKDADELTDVRKYTQYFMGPIIVSEDYGKNYIVDGQQRLTSLTLILICLLHLTDDKERKGKFSSLIYSDDFGEKSFHLDVDERTECMMKLYKGESVNTDDKPESVRNLVNRYNQINEKLNTDLDKATIPLFAEWFIQKVILVEIKTASNEDAYKIFETMNDRGLRLTPAEMLKSYLLSKIRDDNRREVANKSWKQQIDKLIVRKDEDADALKAWLRGRHAEKLQDFERIGSQFHRWVRANSDIMKLQNSDDFANFITDDFAFYADIFLRLRNAAEKFDIDSGLECVYYLAQHNFTLQYPLLIAPLAPQDTKRDRNCKLRVVAAYLDIMVHRRIGNWKTVAESALRSHIFGLIPTLRDKDTQEMADLLAAELEQDEFSTTFHPQFALHGQNRNRVHRILARITDYVERQSARPSHYTDYFVRSENPFQIEHIWHNNYDAVCREEAMRSEDLNENDFSGMRNYIGGLLLIKDNPALGAISYAKKRIYYNSQNILARSLHENCYERNPDFIRCKDKLKLPFEPHRQFQKVDLEKRQTLYREIADKLWHPNRLHEAAKGQ